MAKKPDIPFAMLPIDDPRLAKYNFTYLKERTGYYKNVTWHGFIPSQSKKHVNPTPARSWGWTTPLTKRGWCSFTTRSKATSKVLTSFLLVAF